MGEPLVFYVSLMIIRNFNIMRDIVFNSKRFYVFPSFQKVSKKGILLNLTKLIGDSWREEDLHGDFL